MVKLAQRCDLTFSRFDFLIFIIRILLFEKFYGNGTIVNFIIARSNFSEFTLTKCLSNLKLVDLFLILRLFVNKPAGELLPIAFLLFDYLTSFIKNCGLILGLGVFTCSTP